MAFNHTSKQLNYHLLFIVQNHPTSWGRLELDDILQDEGSNRYSTVYSTLLCMCVCVSYFISSTSSRCFLRSARRVERCASFSHRDCWVEASLALIDSSSCFTFSMAPSSSSIWEHTHTHAHQQQLNHEQSETDPQNPSVNAWGFLS